jgi:hypothetical protein
VAEDGGRGSRVARAGVGTAQVLGADAITTVSGRGYQFTLPVTKGDGNRSPSNQAQPAYQLTSFVGREQENRATRGAGDGESVGDADRCRGGRQDRLRSKWRAGSIVSEMVSVWSSPR